MVLWATAGTLALHAGLGLLLNHIRFVPPDRAPLQHANLQIHLLPERVGKPRSKPKSQSHRPDPPSAQPSAPESSAERRATTPRSTPRQDSLVLAPNTTALDQIHKTPVGNAQDRNHADGSWESDILAHLQRFKRYPTGARLDRLEDRIQVEIQVDRNGQVIQHRILRSAGIPILDQAVNELLHRAAPLPAPSR